MTRLENTLEESFGIDYSQAACGDYADPEVFFPNGSATHTKSIAIAKSICADCPVRSACFEHGVHHEKYGIWGGASPEELRAYRRRHNIVFVPIDPVV